MEFYQKSVIHHVRTDVVLDKKVLVSESTWLSRLSEVYEGWDQGCMILNQSRHGLSVGSVAGVYLGPADTFITGLFLMVSLERTHLFFTQGMD